MISIKPYHHLRRVRFLTFVLFGAFVFGYCSVLKGDFLSAIWLTISPFDYCLSPFAIGFAILLLATPLLWWLSRRFTRLFQNQSLSVCFFSLFSLFFVIGIITNGNEVRTLEYRMARLCAERKYEEALRVGERFEHPSSNVVALRTLALSRLTDKGAWFLAEHFFDYSLPNNLQSHFLQIDSTSKTISPFWPYFEKEQQTSHGQVFSEKRNVELMKYLIDRQIPKFIQSLTSAYINTTRPEELPKAYREAIYLYTRITPQTFIDHYDPATAANYSDFLAFQRKVRLSHPPSVPFSAEAQRNMLRNTYGHTYWYYYFYGSYSPTY